MNKAGTIIKDSGCHLSLLFVKSNEAVNTSKGICNRYTE